MILRTLMITLLCSFSVFAAEHDVRNANYSSHRILAKNVIALEVTFTATINISGSCNHAVLFGGLKKVETAAGSSHLYTPYVADFGGGQTEIGCSGSRIDTISETERIEANDRGYVGMNILAPAGIKITLKEIK